jgi:hypothetical protein
MGMPNFYKCEICNDVYFPGTQLGEAELRAHYENSVGHDIDSVPTEYNVYRCHHQGCGVFKNTVCEMLEHDRTCHTGP